LAVEIKKERYLPSILALLRSRFGLHHRKCFVFEKIKMATLIPRELVFLNVYGAPESIPRNEFRQPM